MIKDKCIVCIPLTTWNKTFTNTVIKMMTLLSKENKVLFVDYQYTFKDVWNGLRGTKQLPIKRIFGLENRLTKVRTEIDSELYVLTCPPVFPINWIKNSEGYKRMLKLNANLVKSSIKNAIQSLDMKDVIMVNGYHPFLGIHLSGQLNESLDIYYCYDEIKGDMWHNHHGPTIEEEYMRKADIVITTSDALYESKSPYAENCYVVKNGVDFNLFHKAAFVSKKNDRRIIGYTGSIDERFDIDTVKYAIESLPEYEFQFVGRITNLRAGKIISAYPNVKMMGSKKPDEIPDHLANMDVCIIPYLKNEVTKGVYPLKINEYLAAGKPVVMTNFANLPEFKNIVSVGEDKESFLRFIQEELGSDSYEKQGKRIEIAKQNSWENKVEEFSAIVAKYFVENKSMHYKVA
jgi:glycosyltransferase involved in cell wall biosynthesis